MAKVPYSGPAGLREPAFHPTPYQEARGATPEAFGAGIAQAVTGIGKELGKFADVMYEHELKRQADKNAADEANLEIQFDKEVATQKADFMTKEGADSEKAYPGYVAGLEKTQEKYRKMASNAAVARTFDMATKRRIGNMMSEGAGRAASETRQYVIGAQKGRQELAAKDAADAASSGNDRQFAQALEDNERATHAVANTMGIPADSPQRENMVRTERSKVIGSHLQALARRDPTLALERWRQHQGKMDPEIREKTYNDVVNNYVNTQSRIYSDQLFRATSNPRKLLLDTISSAEGTTSYGNTDMSVGAAIAAPEKLGRYGLKGDMVKVAAEGLGIDPNASKFDERTQDRIALWIAGSQGLGTWGSLGLSEKNRALAELAVARGATEEHPRALTESMIPALLEGARDQAKKAFPDDQAAQQRLYDATQQRVITQYATDARARKETHNAQRDLVHSEIYEKGLTKREDLSTQAQQAYDAMPSQMKESTDKLMRKIASGDMIGDTPERNQNYLKLLGMAVDRNTRAAFLDIVIADENLTKEQQKDLQKRQISMRNQLEDKDGSRAAIGDVQALLNEARIRQTTVDGSANEDFILFQGLFTVRREDFIAKNKALPKPEENRAIAKQILTDKSTFLGRLFGGPRYQIHDVTSSFRTRAIEAYKKRNNGAVPTEAEIFRIWDRAPPEERNR